MITKLKIGIMPLALEMGRFTDVPLEYRTCRVCDDSLLEDEYHFLLYCDNPELVEIRTRFFYEYKWLEEVEDPTDKVELVRLWLQSQNLRKTARFVEEMVEERKNLMYDLEEE